VAPAKNDTASTGKIQDDFGIRPCALMGLLPQRPGIDDAPIRRRH
jgi:hypothetical protein